MYLIYYKCEFLYDLYICLQIIMFDAKVFHFPIHLSFTYTGWFSIQYQCFPFPQLFLVILSVSFVDKIYMNVYAKTSYILLYQNSKFVFHKNIAIMDNALLIHKCRIKSIKFIPLFFDYLYFYWILSSSIYKKRKYITTKDTF